MNNKVAKAIMDFGLIDNGDKVLIAVSGGKDSLVLLEALALFRRFKMVSFSLEAIHVDVEDVPFSIDTELLVDICKRLDVKINFINIESNMENRGRKAPCFVCSWHRRKALFSYAKEHGFQKLALGHHLDDAVETLLINMAYHANISSLPAKLSMFDGIINLIRPLILLTNKDTAEFANIRKYIKQKESCPFEDMTKRNTARKLVKQLEELHPGAANNLFRSMGNIDKEYLP